MQYEDYLQSGHWALIRSEAMNKANRRCECCRALHKLQGHHLRYRNLFDCTFEDIVILCDPCHTDWHKHYKPSYECSREYVVKFLRALMVKPPVEEKPEPRKQYTRGNTFFLRDHNFHKAIKLDRKKFRRWMNAYYFGIPNKKKLMKQASKLYRELAPVPK